MDVQEVWALLEQHQGERFYTAKGLPFCYTIRGGELFVDRRSKSITISTVAAALQKIAARQVAGEAITGPKKRSAAMVPVTIPSIFKSGYHSQPETDKEV